MKNILITCLLCLGVSLNVQAEKMFELSDQCKEDVMNMITCKVSEDVSADDAIASMKLRANLLNFKLVGHMPLSEQVAAMGGQSGRMEMATCHAVSLWWLMLKTRPG